ncbi:alpha/beta hydrolase [Gordonia jinhuaensis]|uniref:alpha/beta hydrolase n=1 Tax=Gordonia jinhuaensis TaxID=1517702 RepID=UPI001E642E34|nr:alpha/beta hydrolase family protein [Gordonia jinhuaensis]
MSTSPRRSIRLATMVVALVAAIAAALVGAGTASAWGPPANQAPTFRQDYINGYGMPSPLIRTWAAQGVDRTKAPTVIFLDGLRATNDFNGWERDSNVAYLSKHGYNVVMPVGGQSSFYADWQRPSSSAGQKYAYRWESVLTGSLPDYLTRRGFFNRTLVGLSMSASQAVIVANNNRDKYARVVSMSGFLHTTAPTMPSLLRAAAWDSGHYNLNDMWGLYPNIDSFTHDPTLNLYKMGGLHMWIYAGTGVWGNHQPPGANNLDFLTTGLNSTAIESVSREQSGTFATIAPAAGVILRTSFPGVGTHAWGYWQDQIWYIASTGWFYNG